MHISSEEIKDREERNGKTERERERESADSPPRLVLPHRGMREPLISASLSLSRDGKNESGCSHLVLHCICIYICIYV